jgi:hypothetical protein
MNLYLISQSVNNDYDTFDSAIVAAESDEDARRMHPGGDYDEPGRTWTADQSKVQVELIGIAKEDTKAGVVLASFNAG